MANQLGLGEGQSSMIRQDSALKFVISMWTEELSLSKVPTSSGTQ
jgi:hypothetical protein